MKHLFTLLTVIFITTALFAQNIIPQNMQEKDNVSFKDFTCGDIVTDIDGNTYNTIEVGTQCWFEDNLKVIHYPNGDLIPLVTDNTAWDNLANNDTDDAYCWYDNSTTNRDIYGGLYTYAAAIGDNWERDNVDEQGVCPDGWHIPTDAEWTTLIDYLGGESVAGGKLKETGTTHWSTPNTGATNESGFTALPGAYRAFSGQFYAISLHGYWWSGTESNSGSAYLRKLEYDNTNVSHSYYDKSSGYSVRCVKSNAGTNITNPDNSDIHIYPNPANNTINIDLSYSSISNSIKITDINGKTVYSGSIINNNLSLDISNYANGLYFINIETENGTVVEKFIKQ